jgi:hypothetical protein
LHDLHLRRISGALRRPSIHGVFIDARDAIPAMAARHLVQYIAVRTSLKVNGAFVHFLYRKKLGGSDMLLFSILSSHVASLYTYVCIQMFKAIR